VEDPRGDMERHQPPPSLWPVGFAVGIVCLLVGLVVSWIAAAIGAVLAAVFGFLWARDVVRGSKPGLPDPAEEPSLEPPLPPQPGERYPRNVFLENATLGLGAVIGVVVTVPVVGFAVLPAFKNQKQHEVDLGPIGNFPEGQYLVAVFLRDPVQGDITRRAAFIRNNGLLNGVPSFTCISNRCAHVGCPVQPGGPVFEDKTKNIKTANGNVMLVPALPAAGFICPCHGGTYDQEGNRIAGPPVRGLDRYEFLIRNGHLVLGNLYSVAKVTGTGANAMIYKDELHGPGQHVDGPEAWLYPLQPPH
jgi:quinol---cytochrome c reductase iron-sulfur subunit, bacillus type